MVSRVPLRSQTYRAVGAGVAMNILHPTLGDLIDRAVILDLKRRQNDGGRFADEYIEVEIEILKRSAGGAEAQPLERLKKDLRGIHSQIWNINVQFSYLAERDLDPPNHLGLAAWRLNQERIAVLEQIDTLSGEFTRPEKVY